MARLTGDNFNMVGELVTTPNGMQILPIPVDVTPKGVKTITIWLDELTLDETGTREKEVNGRKIPVAYMKFRVQK